MALSWMELTPLILGLLHECLFPYSEQTAKATHLIVGLNAIVINKYLPISLFAKQSTALCADCFRC